MIFLKIYKLMSGLCPETKKEILETIIAIRNGKKIQAREAAERAALRQWARKELK